MDLKKNIYISKPFSSPIVNLFDIFFQKYIRSKNKSKKKQFSDLKIVFTIICFISINTMFF